MTVVECDVPPASMLGPRLVEAAHFRDSYDVPLSHPNTSPVDIFFGIFGHHPIWMKILLIIRNIIASLCGLHVPTVSDNLNPVGGNSYAVGDKIGPWPIFMLTEVELVAGRDNKHLDFRLSVLRETNGEMARVVVSMVCTAHNAFGKIYLFFIVPFHKRDLKRIMLNAVRAGRL